MSFKINIISAGFDTVLGNKATQNTAFASFISESFGDALEAFLFHGSQSVEQWANLISDKLSTGKKKDFSPSVWTMRETLKRALALDSTFMPIREYVHLSFTSDGLSVFRRESAYKGPKPSGMSKRETEKREAMIAQSKQSLLDSIALIIKLDETDKEAKKKEKELAKAQALLDAANEAKAKADATKGSGCDTEGGTEGGAEGDTQAETTACTNLVQRTIDADMVEMCTHYGFEAVMTWMNAQKLANVAEETKREKAAKRDVSNVKTVEPITE